MTKAQNAVSEKINWYRGLPILGKAGIWFAFLMFAIYLAAQAFFAWGIGLANHKRLVEVRNSKFEAKLTVFSSAVFPTDKSLIEVRPRGLFSKPCRAFYILGSDPNLADIKWQTDRELTVTIPESAEVTPLKPCKDVTFTFVRVPSAEKED